MKKVLLVLSVIVGTLNVNLSGQNLELSFSGDNNGVNVTLDSIYIKNLTQGADITIYAPDTSINLVIVGFREQPFSQNNLFKLSQNVPNPFKDNTELSLYLHKAGVLNVEVFNLLGKRVAQFQERIFHGTHKFSFRGGGEKVYILSATAFGITKSIKMFCSSNLKSDCRLNYVGNNLKNEHFKSEQWNKDFPFEPGDELLFVGYNDLGESGIVDSPEESTTYTLQFATNIPCIGVPTVDYEGQVYNTVQIYSQCWFKENLNVGEMIPASQSQTNNNIIQKYCPLDNEYYCNTFAGALYQWTEMMNYTNEPVVQGICPEGWHIPTDLDWKVLEGAVDNDYGIGNPEWDNTDWRGSDVGGNLKQTGTSFWDPPNTGATDAFGFSALPGGYVVQGGYWGGGWKGYFWSSDNVEHFFRDMDSDKVMIKRGNGVGAGLAISVRCLKDKD